MAGVAGPFTWMPNANYDILYAVGLLMSPEMLLSTADPLSAFQEDLRMRLNMHMYRRLLRSS